MPKGIFKRTLEHNKNISLSLSGKRKSISHVINMSKSMKGIGLGRKHRIESILKMNNKAMKGKNNPRWKGNKAKYLTKHIHIYRNFGKANKCENINCPKKCKLYEWSNISGKYKRNISDYKMLCISCHRKIDYKRRMNAKRNSCN